MIDHKNNIAGIANLDESLIIKPKVVFNAIGWKIKLPEKKNINL